MKTFLQIILFFCSITVFGQITVLPTSTPCSGGTLNISFQSINASSITVKIYRNINQYVEFQATIQGPVISTASIPIPNNTPLDNDYSIKIFYGQNTPGPVGDYLRIGLQPDVLISNVGCLGESFQITSIPNDTYTYTWYKDDVDISNSNESPLPHIFSKSTSTDSDIGIYKLKVVSNGFCEYILPILNKTFYVRTPPTSNGQSINSGNTATLTAAGCASASETKWYDGTTLANTGATFATPPLVNSKTYRVLCEPANGYCPSEPTLVTVTVNGSGAPAPPTLAKSATTVCEGSPITFTATCAGGTIKWYDSATTTTVLSTENPYTSNAILQKPGIYKIYADCRKNNFTSLTRSTISVNVTDVFKPVVDDKIINQSSNITMTVGACSGGTVKWYDTNTSSSPIYTGNSFTTPALNGPADYFVSCTKSLCESERDPINISTAGFNAGTMAAPILDASVDYVCGSGTSIITASGCSNGTVNWYASSNTNIILATGTTYTTPTLSNIGTFTYWAKCFITKQNVTISSSIISIPIIVYPSNIPTVTGTTISEGGSTTLNAGCHANQSVIWYEGGTQVATTPNFITPILNQTKTYTVECFSTANKYCWSGRISVLVNVTPVCNQPTAYSTTLSAGNSISLRASNCNNGTIKWYTLSGTTYNLVHSGVPYTTPVLNNQAIYSYYVTCSKSGCESTKKQVNVTVSCLIPVPSAANTTVPYGSAASLTASGCPNNVAWRSTPGDNILFQGANNIAFNTPTNLTQNPTLYYASCNNGTCGNDANTSALVTVNLSCVVPVPTTTNVTVPYGTSASLTASGCPNNVAWRSTGSTTTLFEGANNVAFNTPNLTQNPTQYYVSCNNGTCGNTTNSRVLVTVNLSCAIPVPNSTNVTIPYGTSTSLSASGCPNNVAWRSTVGGAILFEGANNVAFNTPSNLTQNPTTYYVSCNNGTCGIDANTSAIVTVNLSCVLPILSTSNVTVPYGTSASLSASGCPNNVAWRSTVGGTLLFEGANNVAFNTPNLIQNPTTYYVSCNNGTCGNNVNASVLATVNVLPCIPPNAPNADGGIFAENSTATLTASSCSGDYRWYYSATATNYLQSSTSSSFTTPLLVVGSPYYYVSCFQGCESSRTPIYLNVLPTLKTNNTWKVSQATQSGEEWTTAGFDDSQWGFALDNFNPNPCFTGGGKQIWFNQLIRQAFFRKKFYISYIPSPAIVKFNTDGGGNVYINGQLVYSDGDCNVTTSNEIDITNFLTVGENIISAYIDDFNCGQPSYFCMKSNIPNSGCNANIASVSSNSPIPINGTAVLTASGCSGTYRWYNQATGGFFGNQNPHTVSNITVPTTFYVSCFNTADNCESPRYGKHISIGVSNGGCSQEILLMSTADDYNTGVQLKKTNEKITARNQITNSAQATYRSNKSIILDTGFIVLPTSSGYFKAELGGCN